MDIEQYILNTWNKIPKKFKDRVDCMLMVGREMKKGEIIKIEKIQNEGIFFNKEELEDKIQTLIDKEVIKALHIHHGFTEDEADQLLEKISKL